MKFKNPIFMSFVICFLLGVAIVLPNAIMNDGIYHLTADFDYQEIPFHMIMNESFKNGNYFYTWFNDLGSNFIGSFSFYNLFSPFTFFLFLFPSSYVPYLLGFMFPFKYGFAGLFSYLYMRRYVKDSKYAILGAVLYSFSGFQLTNILFFHFHDVVAFFPLLLYSLDEIFYHDKKGYFGLSVFLMAITNWFFLIACGIFVFLYFLLKVIMKEYCINPERLFRFFGEGILGLLMASFILVPTFLFTLSNPRIISHWTLLSLLKYPSSTYIEIIRAFIFPPDSMITRSFFYSGNYSSVELYLPVIGSIFVFTYLIKKPKDFFSILLFICFLFMFIPIFNSAFVLFRSLYYARWFFMPILMMSLVSMKAMEEKLNIRKGIIISICFIVLLVGLTSIYYTFRPIKIFHYNNLLISFLFCMVGIFITKFWAYKFKFIFITVILFISFYGNYMVGLYQIYQNPEMKYSSFVKKDNNLALLKNQRSYSRYCSPNISLVQSIPNIYSFHSNISGEAFSFYHSLGIQRDTSTIIDNPKVLEFLGVKKMITCKDNQYIISELDALPIGYSPSDIELEEVYDSYHMEDKINILMDHVVLNENQAKKYHHYVNGKVTSTNFHFLKNGFSIDYDALDDSFLVIQVPYDDGWRVSDKDIMIENVDHGMMGIVVPKGKGSIHFSYHVPGLFIGVIISVFSIFIYLIYGLKKRHF